MSTGYSEDHSILDISEEVFHEYDRRVNNKYYAPVVQTRSDTPFDHFYSQYKLYAQAFESKEKEAKERWADDASEEWSTDHFYMYYLLKGKIILEEYVNSKHEIICC